MTDFMISMISPGLLDSSALPQSCQIDLSVVSTLQSCQIQHIQKILHTL
jgi:predicted nucleic acid binding AN1-type Zn finger protein